MCCSCEQQVCMDRTGTATDMRALDCSRYLSYSYECGFADDADFLAREMCCGCIEGGYDINLGATDSYGYGCELYY